MTFQPKNETEIAVDTIVSKTGGSTGVTTEDVKMASGAITGATTIDQTGAHTVDTINEHTTGAGVTVEGVLHKDSFSTFSNISAPSTPASNKVALYAASDILTAKDDAGDTWQLTPAWGSWTPTYGGACSPTLDSLEHAEYFQFGPFVAVSFGVRLDTASLGNQVTLSSPVTIAEDSVGVASIRTASSGSTFVQGVVQASASSNVLAVQLYDASNISAGSERIFRGTIFYRA
jgi:hypothetical protein